MKIFKYIIILICLSQITLADDFEEFDKKESVLFGFNVTTTTETPKAGTTTIGSYVLGYALTDELFLVTSPWIWIAYNTGNLHLKWGHQTSDTDRIGLFISYFESFNSSPLVSDFGSSQVGKRPTGSPPPPPSSSGFGLDNDYSTQATETIYEGVNRYQWKSASLHFLYSHENTATWTSYYNIHYGYFWNDDFPYSIRMDPGTDKIRGQVDITSAHAFKIAKTNWYYLLEIGGLGVNYLYPYFQFGSALTYLDDGFMLQVGASATMQFNEMTKSSGWTPGRYDSRLHYSLSENKYYYYRYLQTALHPEVQLQFWF